MTQMPKLTEMQSAAADRAYHLLQTYHAAIIAMPTGTGKTYIACRLIRMFADDPDAAATVVAPAHLLPMWRRAADAFGIHPRFASYQMLSLGRAAADAKAPILWIFDEAHALKNSNSKRYRFAQKHTAVHYVCLMTATPVSMSWNDICALTRLCGYPSGQKFFDKYMIQRFAHAICIDSDIPQSIVSAKKTHEVYDSPILASPEAIAAIADALRSVRLYISDDDADARETALLPHILMHRFLSHPHSCLMTLDRLIRYYKNARTRDGQFLSRRNFLTLMGISGNQLLLPFEDYFYGKKLGCITAAKLDRNLQKLRYARVLIENACIGSDPAVLAVQNLIAKIPPGERVVLFTQYADTALHYAARLCVGRPTALLTAQISRYGNTACERELIETVFDASCPIPDFYEKSGIRPPEILICSDAFSSGHNLQRANRLIHLDLPHNPATLIQREGRLLRMGQTADAVHFFAPRYPDRIPRFSDCAQAIEKRLNARKKLIVSWYLQPLAPTCDAVFSIDCDHFPKYWARFSDQWIPIDPGLEPFAANSTQTTFGRLHHAASAAAKKRLLPLWQMLKSDGGCDAEKCNDIFGCMNCAAVFPRIAHAIPDIAADAPLSAAGEIAEKSAIIRRVFKLPPPNAPCKLYAF